MLNRQVKLHFHSCFPCSYSRQYSNTLPMPFLPMHMSNVNQMECAGLLWYRNRKKLRSTFMIDVALQFSNMIYIDRSFARNQFCIYVKACFCNFFKTFLMWPNPWWFVATSYNCAYKHFSGLEQVPIQLQLICIFYVE